ncbi:MAG: RIP metalloprotease RseP, partial [Gammaproteobacteria bacterium]
MMQFVHHLLAFIVALGILITFHEFGHYWVARKCGVKILRFSIGFGRPLWKRCYGPDRTEFVVAALPLGGYVKMLDEREAPVPESELQRAFNRRPLGQRFAIVLAGPLFNFLFAILAYWIMYMVGLMGLKPVIGAVQPDSIAAAAGLRADEEIVAVNSQRTATWTMVVDAMITNIMADQPAELRLKSSQAPERPVLLPLQGISIDDLAEKDLLAHIGITPLQLVLPPIIGELQPGGAAVRAGLKSGDRILAVDDVRIPHWSAFVEYIKAHPDQLLNVEIDREGRLLSLPLRPDKKDAGDGKVSGFIGAGNQLGQSLLARESYSFFPAFARAVVRTWDMSWLTLQMLGKIITGEASVRNLSGPVSIAQYAGESAKNGVAAFLWFLGIVSVSLGVLNLLPVPLLDGGHLMYYLIELVRGSPVPDNIQAIG